MVIRAALMAIMVAGGPTPSVSSGPPPAPAASPASSPGAVSREMPVPIAVRGAQDLTFKTEIERQYLILLLPPRRNDDDGDLRGPPDALKQLEALAVR